MSGTQGYVALEWIRGELENTLHNAQVGLEAVSESADAATSMRTCLTAIHQVHGTLKMVQLEGPTQMAAEMEQVAQSLMNNSVTEVRLAQETLMQAILQLPTYLDRLHREQEDSEKNYLPMVNNLRAVRGEERIQGSAAELEEGDGPDLGPLTQAASGEVVNAYFQRAGESNLPKIRTRYLQCLGEILRKTQVRKNLTTIGKLFTMLVRLCGDSPTGNLAELGLGVVEGVLTGGIKLDNQTATRLKQIDDHLEHLAQAGQHVLSMPVDEELAIGLIKLINGSKKETKKISALRQRYASEAPASEEFTIGPDDETMSAVASILIEELNSVTDKLDLFVRAQNRNTDDLAALLPTLEQISSTMIILDNTKQRIAVANQISIIKELETSGEPSEDVLFNMAQALIEIGAELGQLVVGSGKERTEDSFGNLDEAQAAVIRETRIGLAAGKDSVIDFIASEFDHTKIEGLPQSLNTLRSGLIIVNQLQAGDVLKAAANYVANALLSGSQKPELEQMDDLADAITSIDYYLERLLDNPSDPYLQMLEVAETAVKKFGYTVGAEGPTAAPAAEVVEGAAEVVADLGDDVIEEVLEEPVEVTALVSETEDDVIDDEILEIFVDEAEEVLETILEFLPIWKSEPTNEQALTEIRRAFHTLKGSGRMVGATVVGELAWSIENLLNRVIEKTVTANPAVMDVITEVVGRIPEGVTAFKEGQQNRFKPDELVAIAGALTEGRTPSAISTTAASEPEAIEESVELEEIIVTANVDSPEPAVDSPEPAVDSPELAVDSPKGEEIFTIEAEEKLEVIDGFVANPGDVSSELFAAFHSLKGSAAMVEISSISTVATPLEHLVNQYLVQNKPADPHFIDAVQEAASLIRTVLQDIPDHRDSVPGLDALIDRLAVSTIEDEPARGFDFREIKLLSEPNIATDGWQDVEALVSELKIAKEQGVTLNQPDLVALIASMRRIYSEGSSTPDDQTLSLMKRAHDHLVFMFDALASSQTLRPAGGVIAELEAIDFSTVEVEATPETIPEAMPEAIPEAMPEVLMAPGVEGAPVQEPPAEAATRALTELPADDIDDDVLPIFLEETEDLLEEIDQSIFGWSESGSLGDNLDNLLRQLHTLKGGARMAGAASLGEYAHNVETFLIEVQSRPVDFDEPFFALLNSQQDEITRRVEIYQKLAIGSASPEELESLKTAVSPELTNDGPAEAVVAPSASINQTAVETPAVATQADELSVTAVSGDGDAVVELPADEVDEDILPIFLEESEDLVEQLEPALETDPVEALYIATDDSAPAEPGSAIEGISKDESAASASQEMVRVSAELLEELIGLAGESSITRGRVEQQITDFNEHLQEMEETINRIRVQVRRLEIEADSRESLIRSRQGAEGDSGFDDLEMDRYTMLQAISRVLSEGSSDMMDLKDTLGNRVRDAETLLHQQARISAELQEGLTRTRMVQLSRLIPRLRRIVRQVSSEVGKSVRFDAYNIEGELDRNVLERIVAPLEHMLRNSVDHGIEDKEARVASGKQVQGRISLRLSREAGYVVLAISDDGGGIDVNAVRDKAIERGLITEGQDVSDHEVMQFIMHAGFSTAQKLTQISGRGVGMDVVGSEIKALGGSMAIDSTLGVGTEFTIRIPFTVSINRALMVVVKEETYAIPLNTIEGIVRVSPYELETYYQPDAPMFEYAGQQYKLAYIGKMLDKVDDPNLAGQVVPLPVILARSGDHAVALQVDRVIGSREMVVKTLGAQFGNVGGISGATVLGDGSVVIILDCMALVRRYEASVEASVNVPTDPVVAEAVPGARPVNKVRTVMIVDDSVTVRKVTSRLMERQGFAVVTAKDGVDAMDQLQTIRPDVVLLDIEMPRMDGFEVLRSVRRDENLKDLPVIMITSRTGEKHKQQAMELGVNQYLGKPFQEAKLLATIEEVIASVKAKPEQN
jgi:chemosensory pili system protein ChpA (sensor histidine kinase/response regulator)